MAYHTDLINLFDSKLMCGDNKTRQTSQRHQTIGNTRRSVDLGAHQLDNLGLTRANHLLQTTTPAIHYDSAAYFGARCRFIFGRTWSIEVAFARKQTAQQFQRIELRRGRQNLSNIVRSFNTS
jgi:hypothetical protein